MPAPTIQIDQPTPGVGLLGVPRSDLVLGELVTLSDPANPPEAIYLWQMLDFPVGSAVPIGIMSVASTATFTPDVSGTYLFKLSINNLEFATLAAAVLTANKGHSHPSLGERLEFGAKGWHAARDAMLRAWDGETDAGALICLT